MRRTIPVPGSEKQLTPQVVNHIHKLIKSGRLAAGDKIPPEREFAAELKMSRASLRAGIGYLAAMGVLQVRHGIGTFVADGPPALGTSSLELLSSLHGFSSEQVFEARLLLETHLAAMAAKRGHERHFAALADEVAEMYATLDDPQEHLIHDIRFHRTIAEAAGNPVLAALMETIATAFYEERRRTVMRSRDLKQAAESHREIYRAIRGRDASRAQQAMERHLKLAEIAQGNESRNTALPNGRPASRRSQQPA